MPCARHGLRPLPCLGAKPQLLIALHFWRVDFEMLFREEDAAIPPYCKDDERQGVQFMPQPSQNFTMKNFAKRSGRRKRRGSRLCRMPARRVLPRRKSVVRTVPLQYTWEDGGFRRIVRCPFGAGDLVLKVRREEDVSLSRLSSQCAFSEYLAENGIRTARFLSVCPSGEGAWKKEDFAAALPAEGGPVLVTLEYFCEGQLTAVTPELAEAAGRRSSGLRPAAFSAPSYRWAGRAKRSGAVSAPPRFLFGALYFDAAAEHFRIGIARLA